MDLNPTDVSAFIKFRTRRASLEDAEGLARLAEELGHRMDSEELSGRLAELARDPGTEIFVAVDEIGDRDAAALNGNAGASQAGDVIVGWVHVLVMKTLVGSRRAHLGGLVVDERYRGQKVGRVLLGRAEEWAAEQGCVELVLRSRHSRKRAHVFYTGHGYTLAKTQHVFKRKL